MWMSCFSSTTLHKSLVGASLWTTPYPGVLKFYVKSERERTNLIVNIYIWCLFVLCVKWLFAWHGPNIIVQCLPHKNVCAWLYKTINDYLSLLPTHTGSPPTGSFTGQWYQESVTSRRSINRLLLTVVPYCPSQIVPIFEDRAFRTGM